MKRLPYLFHILVVKYVYGLYETNGMRYKCKEVLYPGCPCFNWPEVKETVLHQLPCPLLPMIHLSKGIVDSLQKCTKIQDKEPTMCVILYCYIKVKGQKLL